MRTALIAVATGKKADGRSVRALQARGMVAAGGGLTSVGYEGYLDLVETSEVYVLTLGAPLSGVKTADGKTYKIQKGARLVALWAGVDKKCGRWYDCFISAKLPIVRVLHNRAHKIEKHRVPVADLQ